MVRVKLVVRRKLRRVEAPSRIFIIVGASGETIKEMVRAKLLVRRKLRRVEATSRIFKIVGAVLGTAFSRMPLQRRWPKFGPPIHWSGGGPNLGYLSRGA